MSLTKIPCWRSTAKNSAETRAVAFLLGARSPRIWKDFTAFGTPSDEWVTAYTACALAGTADSDALEAAHEAWAWLALSSAHHGPGWGYNSRTSQDADSTVWGCRLAAAIGKSSDESALRALRCLQTVRVRPDGGMATFVALDLKPLHLGNPVAIAGWTQSHACVTAAAACLDELTESADLRGFLVRAQQPEGFWNAYWWADDEYATAHALESLSRGGVCPELLWRSATWLAEGSRGRSPFVLALRILGIAHAGGRDFEPIRRELLELQLPDGSWPASARLRIPPPSLTDPRTRAHWDEKSNGIGSILLDRGRIFSTATALRALSACPR